ncbi:MAG: hypothetical protein OK422_05620 [Thaumarchaeota archaeon]|nr:hypothetical protein [Nitrososphaerota archaeon]
MLGESGAEAVIRLGQIPGDKLDSQAIDASLNQVFGASPEGLSAVQTRVLDGMSTELGFEPSRGSGEFGFYASLEKLSERYRLKEMTGFGMAGVVAAGISSLCCLGPIALALLGFASLSASLSLAMNMMSTYHPIELAAAIGFLGVTVYFQLRRHGQCSIAGLRRNLAYVVIPGTTLLVSYAIINYMIGVTFFGSPGNLLPWPIG